MLSKSNLHIETFKPQEAAAAFPPLGEINRDVDK
jgi:hypothetical protein